VAETQKPVAAFVLSLIGGIISLIASLVIFWIALVYSSIPPWYRGGMDVIFAVFGGWLLVAAIVVIVGSITIYQHPEKCKNWGIIILVFSILGGGGILGIIGGVLAIVWKPTLIPPPTVTPAIMRICPQCGRVLTHEVKFCPYCGKELG